MARENQGLQIALIIFVILTIILGVTTFLFFRQYEEATAKAEDLNKQLAQLHQRAWLWRRNQRGGRRGWLRGRCPHLR